MKEVRDMKKNLDATKFAFEKQITEYKLKNEGLSRQMEDKENTIREL